jgi:hypothetical protein
MTEPVASSTVISYARAQYDAEILDLATRLRADGVPCALDRFEMRPPGGWSRWMTEKMTGTDIVLVVCSKAWYERYHLNENPGVGAGATFEGGMLSRRVLEAQGTEHGVIPILFDASDVQYIPEFLRDETRFLLPEQFDDLYRVLTHQPAIVPPPVGKIRLMPPINQAAGRTPAPSRSATDGSASTVSRAADIASPSAALPLALFALGTDHIFGRYRVSNTAGNTLSITLVVEDDSDEASFPRLRPSADLYVVLRSELYLARTSAYRDSYENGQHLVEITLNVRPFDPRGGIGAEMSINGITVDQIATHRARRILLDERAPDHSALGAFSTQRLNEDMLESYVSNRSSGLIDRGPVEIHASPIPQMVGLAVDSTLALACARLECIYLLLATRTVERVERLDLTRSSGGVDVAFGGIRARQYSNADPYTITVTGTCPLG